MIINNSGVVCAYFTFIVSYKFIWIFFLHLYLNLKQMDMTSDLNNIVTVEFSCITDRLSGQQDEAVRLISMPNPAKRTFPL